MVQTEILRMEGITKAFGGVKAVDNVDFALQKGEIHALMGANGAGKSTLMKVLAGVYRQDAGKIFLEGQEIHMKNVASAHAQGITMVFQELNVAPHLSVLENIFLSREIVKNGVYNWKEMREKAKQILDEMGVHLDLDIQVRRLSVAMQQMVEIARALNANSKIIIFDEPTSSLSVQEVEQLFKIMANLKAKGISMVYISHRLEEIYRICERITLMRDGRHIFTDDIENVSHDRLIAGIIGAEPSEQFPPKQNKPGKVIFEAKNITCNGKFQDISFTLREGEILGFAGLAGAGRTEVAKAIFGCYGLDEGTMVLEGKSVRFKHPRKAIDSGLAYVSEDRKGEGILAVRCLCENMTISNMNIICSSSVIKHRKEKSLVQDMIDRLHIKTSGLNHRMDRLSGGNQQKVCFGRWIMNQPRLLILDEPTRGVDVGARADFYRIINDLAKNNVGVIVISSEEDELIGLCNRIVVMRNGRKVAELDCNEDNLKEKLMRNMLGVEEGVNGHETIQG
ncbi:MAG: sugar ABC transporter ATP-binding protein [Clostridiales bacterium]|nr:sugar ABC transporter ATP-binding protein [Clostridiales bacterium]